MIFFHSKAIGIGQSSIKQNTRGMVPDAFRRIQSSKDYMVKKLKDGIQIIHRNFLGREELLASVTSRENVGEKKAAVYLTNT